jgi:cysteine desulfurase family protein (TIGR01976 family)
MAAARLFGATAEELVLGPSSTLLVDLLARGLRPTWAEGDEVIVTNLDHETNVGPWRRLEETGIVVKEWRFRPETVSLELPDLVPLLTSRTRLVAFTHCANVVGTVHDVRQIADAVRAAGALSCVDGVAFAPHRRVDVRALGADFYFASFYKLYGPHVSGLFGRGDALRNARGQNHFFVGEERVPLKFEPGNVNYEATAALVGIVDYLEELAEHHGVDFFGAFELMAAHEADLVHPLLAFLAAHPRVRLIGESSSDPARRVPTVAFVVEGRKSSEIPPLLDQRRIAARYGHFYAYRPIRDLGLLECDGVVRVSLVHYNSPEEVARLIEVLDEVL